MTSLSTQIETIDDDLHPLDCVEDVLHAHNWDFNRITEDELIVEVRGKSGKYRLLFIWQHEMQAMQFCAQLDLKIAKSNLGTSRDTLHTINENLWMGHFDVPEETVKPSYRHTCLMRGIDRVRTPELIEDMIDIALAQCENHYPLFALLSSANDVDQDTLSLALMDTAGES